MRQRLPCVCVLCNSVCMMYVVLLAVSCIEDYVRGNCSSFQSQSQFSRASSSLRASASCLSLLRAQSTTTESERVAQGGAASSQQPLPISNSRPNVAARAPPYL